MGDHVLSKEFNAARGGRNQPKDHADGRRFPCTIRTKKAKDVSRVDIKIELVDDRTLFIHLRQSHQFEYRLLLRCLIRHSRSIWELLHMNNSPSILFIKVSRPSI